MPNAALGQTRTSPGWRVFVCTAAAIAALAAPAAAQVTRTYPLNQQGTFNPCSGNTLYFPNVEDVLVQSVSVTLTLSTGDVRLVDIGLSVGVRQIGVPHPQGAIGTPVALNGTYTFNDTATQSFWDAIAAGPSLLPPGAYHLGDGSGGVIRLRDAFRETRSEAASLSLGAWCGGGVGITYSDVVLTITGDPVPAIDVGGGVVGPATAKVISDGKGPSQQPGDPLDIPLAVPAGRGVVQSVVVDLYVDHRSLGDVVAQLVAPDGTAHVLFGYTGATDSGPGSPSLLSGTHTFTDRATASWWNATNRFSSAWRTSALGGPGGTGADTLMDAVFAGKPAEGVWRLRLTDGSANGVIGTLYRARLTLITSVAPNVPVGAPESFVTPHGVPLVVPRPGVLVNDTTSTSGSFTALLDTLPAFGQVALSWQGSFTYTPNPGFSGRDTFTYRAVNLLGHSAAVPVDIDVRPPVTLPMRSASGIANAALLGPIPKGAPDPVTGVCVGGGLSVPITISDSLLVRRATLTIDVTHSFVPALSVRVTSPSGRWHSVKLATTSAISAGLDGVYVLDDVSAVTLNQAAQAGGTVPPGHYRADATIDWAEPGDGTWTIRIADGCNASNAGSVAALSLTLDGVATATFPARPSSLGAIPESPGGPYEPGPARDVTFVVPPGGGTVTSVAITATVYHGLKREVLAELIAPDGTAHSLFAYPDGDGISTWIDCTCTFTDLGSNSFWDTWGPRFPGDDRSFRTIGPSNPGGLPVPTVMDAAFAGKDAAGVWTLRVRDGAIGGRGHVSAASLHLVTSSPPPLPTTVADTYTVVSGFTLQVPASGVLRNDVDPGGGGLSAVAESAPAAGVLQSSATGGFTYTSRVGFTGTDTFSYRAVNAGGAAAPALVSIVVTAPTTADAPSNFRVFSLSGAQVTLRWTPSPLGLPAEGYVVEGGVTPGQTIASIATPTADPVLHLTTPAGVFYLRVRAVAGGVPSGPSNEIRLVVHRPEAPTSPMSFSSAVSGGTVVFGWQPTFGGGAATGWLLDVTGTLAGTVPLPPGEAAVFPGVPPGSYSATLRATNAAGASLSSLPTTFAVPQGACQPPGPPADFLAYASGGAVHLLWEPPNSGGPATHYRVDVSGAFVGSFVTPTRAISGAAPQGMYQFTVIAENVCGQASSAARTVVVQ